MISELRSFADEYGMLGHKDAKVGLDFGDSPQRTFSYYIYRFFEEPVDILQMDSVRIAKILDRIFYTLPAGAETNFSMRSQYRRHHSTMHWFGEPWTLSRDQLLPMWICCILYAPFSHAISQHLLRIELLMANRKGLCWNYRRIWFTEHDEPKFPDVVNPLFRLAMFYRKNPVDLAWWEKALVWAADLELIVMATIIVVRSRRGNPENTSDDLNFHLHMILAANLVRSPCYSVARWVYKRWRRKPAKFSELPVAMAVQRSYFDQPTAPPMYLVAEPALRKYL